MKSALPISVLSLAIAFASCTTAYKTGQTPDDVYYSPERPQDEYVRVEDNEEKSYSRNNNNRRNERFDEDYYDDRYLRMKVRNRRVWSDLDFYYSDPFAYNYYNRYNRYSYYNNYYWNPYTYWNHYYNPYGNVIVVNPKSPVYNKPRTTNLHVFDAPDMNTNNPKYSNGKTRVFGNSSSEDYNSPSPRRNVGSDLRNIFGSGSSNNSSSSNNAPSRSSDNSSNTRSSSTPSSSSGSSSGGNAPVRKF